LCLVIFACMMSDIGLLSRNRTLQFHMFGCDIACEKKKTKRHIHMKLSASKKNFICWLQLILFRHFCPSLWERKKLPSVLIIVAPDTRQLFCEIEIHNVLLIQ
jgi:hypothetical protein